MKTPWIICLLLPLLCGCFETKDELTLNADGSGTVHIETRTTVPPEMLAGMGMGMGGSETTEPFYPPISKADARKFFPGDDFTVSVKEKADKGQPEIVIDATFKNVQALLASPYARAHSLAIKVRSNALSIKALAGVEGVARIIETKDTTGMFGVPLGRPGDKKDSRMEFRITLPNAVAAANGAKEGKTVTWSWDRTKFKDTEAYASELATVLEASCTAENVKFTPTHPPRLALLPFAQLPAGASGPAATGPDTKKVQEAARFVPYALQVTRSLDLSGEGAHYENSAQLTGAIVLPRELAPRKWGEIRLDEVLDASGKSLKPERGRGDTFGSSRYTTHFGGEDEDENGDEDAKSQAEHRHTVTIGFQPPDWKVKQIAKIKASIPLHYFSGSQVIKLSNAVPAKWITDATKAFDFDGDSDGRLLQSPSFVELGLVVRFQTGFAQTGMTMLMLNVEGDKATISEVQVFDAKGKPWPTWFQTALYGGDSDGGHIVIAGRPEPPLSLAFNVSGGASAVEVPISLENIPVTAK